MNRAPFAFLDAPAGQRRSSQFLSKTLVREGRKPMFVCCADWRVAKQYPGLGASRDRISHEFQRRFRGRRPYAQFDLSGDPVELAKAPDKREPIALLKWPIWAMPGDGDGESLRMEVWRPGDNEIHRYAIFNLAEEIGPQIARAKKQLLTEQKYCYETQTRTPRNNLLIQYLRLLDADSCGELNDAAGFFYASSAEEQQRDSALKAVQEAKAICQRGLVRQRKMRSEIKRRA